MGVLRKIPPAYTFLRDTFFKRIQTFVTQSVDVDIVKGRRELAPFVSPLVGGRQVANEGYVTKNIKTARVEPKITTTAHDLMHRMPGEELYSDRSPADRAVEKLRNDLARLEEMVTRREEWMCAKVIFSGRIPIVGEGVNYIVSFGFTNHTDISADPVKNWDNGTGIDILGDIDTWLDTVATNGFVNCTCAVMAPDVARAIIRNPDIKELLDIKDYNIARIAPKDLPNGTSYVGTVSKNGLDLYVYREKYLDDTVLDAGGNPTLQPLVPAGTIAFLPESPDFAMYYGAVTYIPEGSDSFVTAEGRRIPHSWVARDPDRRYLSLVSCPMPVPHQVDAWYTAKVM
jgi:hypothetical protein